jgi:hypothetical protein
MTWEELKEKALELGYEYKKPAYAEYYIFSLNKDNVIIQFYADGEIMVDETIFAQNRTPDQMYQIMLALR